ncbi:hypothetical protein PV646_28640 [Streptomyces sp. ID05-26A]|nr:hypothetical protein [Streptomyces sp. ID05-26A]
MHPGFVPQSQPTPPDFQLRKLTRVAYGMSVTTGGIGQVLFLGAVFGGGGWYFAAVGLAAFAEFVMAASGDASLDHRVHGRAWKLMLALSLTVAAYAAANQVLHFWHQNKALAATFAGASVAGFLLHILDGHIKAAAYLRDLRAWHDAQTSTSESTPAPRKTAAARTTKPTASTISAAAADAPTVVMPAALDTAPEHFVPAEPVEALPTGNVLPISSAKGVSQRELVWRWFAEQVDAAGGDVNAVTGPDLVAQFGAEHLRKKISDLRKRYLEERTATAVNE